MVWMVWTRVSLRELVRIRILNVAWASSSIKWTQKETRSLKLRFHFLKIITQTFPTRSFQRKSINYSDGEITVTLRIQGSGHFECFFFYEKVIKVKADVAALLI